MKNARTPRNSNPSPHPEPAPACTDLPDTSWDEARLLDYMRRHDRAIEGLERKSLQHEYCFGAAAQLKYEQLGGKWTRWAKDQGYPKETFRRRRLLFVRAGSMHALVEYPGKMEAYYDLGIYTRPGFEELESLDAGRPGEPRGDWAEATPTVPLVRPVPSTPWGRPADPIAAGGAEESLADRLAPAEDRPDDPAAALVLGKVVNLMVEAERLGPDASCRPLVDDIAAAVARLRDAIERGEVAA